MAPKKTKAKPRLNVNKKTEQRLDNGSDATDPKNTGSNRDFHISQTCVNCKDS
jgi:hypothetical protein